MNVPGVALVRKEEDHVMKTRLCIVALTALLYATPVASAHDGETLGSVHFPVSCAPAIQGDFERAVALLHSFWYEEAVKAFTEITTREPKCAMGYWGIAMSVYYPLWQPPSPAMLQKGAAARRFAWAEAITAFSRAVAAARTGDAAQARAEARKLEGYRAALISAKQAYWAEQVDIQQRTASAWAARAEGKNDEALTLMRAAADLEDSYGAARAAELSSNKEKARTLYTRLVALCDRADSERPELKHAKATLAK